MFLKPNDKGELEIVRLARGGSAERSNAINQGDIVMEVDNQDVYKKDFSVFAKLIQGPVGTYVKVKVAKGSDMNRQTEIALERTLNPEESAPPPQAAPPQRVSPAFQQPPLSGSMSSAADIGIDFKADETGCFQISGMKPGGPAQASNQVDIGDILYEIDGVKVLYGIGPNGRSLSNIEITEMLRGPEGSILNLRLQKGRMGRLAHVNLTRTSGLAKPASPAGPAPPAAPPSQPNSEAPDPPRRSPAMQQQQMQRAAAPARAPILPPDRGDEFASAKSKDDATIPAVPQPRPPMNNQGPPAPPPAPPGPPAPPQPPSPKVDSYKPPPQLDSYQPPQVDTYQPPPQVDTYQPPAPPSAGPPAQPPMTPLYGTHQSGFSGYGDQQQDSMYGDPNMPPQQQQFQQDPRHMQFPPGMDPYGAPPPGMDPYGAPPPGMGGPPQFGFQPPPQVFMPPQPAPPPQLDKTFAENYQPEQPDRFGLGLTFKPYGTGQLRVQEVLPGGPAEHYGRSDIQKDDIQKGDWLHHIDMVPVYKQPTAKVIQMLQGKMKGDVVRLGLRRPTDREQRDREVFIVKGNTGVKLPNCGVGIVFKQDFDDYGTGWVRVAQVVPGGPAKKSLNDEDIIKVNDRIVEVNGEQVAKQPLHRWVSKLKGPEGSSCVLTLGDVHAELYTCNILRGHVDQAKVDPNADKIAPPLIEKPIVLQARKIAPQKKYMVNLYGVTCGISFVTNSEGEVVIDHLNPDGPAAKVEGISPGDILREIGDGPDTPTPREFPVRDVYKKPVQEWMNVITQGMPEEKVQFTFERMNGSQYEAIIEREILANVKTGQEELARVGLHLSKHGQTVVVDHVEQGSDAQKVGIQAGYQLLTANNEPMTGNLDKIQERMNEILVAPFEQCKTPVELLFNTALGKIKFRVLRDVRLLCKQTRSKPRKNKDAQPIPFYEGLMPGEGIPERPMCNPALWKSLQDVLKDPNAVPPPDPRNPQQALPDAFIWRGRILRKPVVKADTGMTSVQDYNTDEYIYWGPGEQEPSLLPTDPTKSKFTSRVREIREPTKGPNPNSVKPMSPPVQRTPAQQTPAPPSPPGPERDAGGVGMSGPQRVAPQQQAPVQRAAPPAAPPAPAAAPEPPKPAPAPPAPAPAPASPAAAPAAPAAPAGAPAVVGTADDEDDESILHLNDGTTCPASELEAILKKHLPAVQHLMVVGSKRQMLSCMLTLKTLGSEAVEAGQDIKDVAEPLKLATAALELAQKVGSEAKDVKEARADNKFRTLGLLPGFSAANQEINNSARQVRRFSILMSNFTIATGELNADGSMARLKIKKQWKSTIEGMYAQKQAPKPAA